MANLQFALYLILAGLAGAVISAIRCEMYYTFSTDATCRARKKAYRSICPWTVFEKQRCTDAQYHCDPIPLRLRRLRGWEKKLVNILERSDL